MKILFVLIDMLRPNLMNLFNDKIKEFEIDDELKKIGGNIFTNCFSPSPDTPRSFGALWSGLTPKKNGCNKRVRYPKFYLDNSNENMLQLLSRNGYSFNFFLKSSKRECGLLPKGFETIGYHNTNFNLSTFLNEIKITDNSFTYIDLSDFHYANDDYSHNYLATKIGYQKIADSLKIINQKLTLSEFDITVVFSDHGHKMDKERRTEPMHFLLNRDRSNVYLQLKMKDDVGIKLNNKFCAIYDIYPTILELTNLSTTTNLDGISLFNEKAHDYIIAEDHFTFAPIINQNIDIWAVIKKNGFYFRTLDSFFFDNKDAFKESQDELDSLLIKNANQFSESLYEKKILTFYTQMNIDNKTHSDGTPRFNRKKNRIVDILYQIINRVALQNLKSFIYK